MSTANSYIAYHQLSRDSLDKALQEGLMADVQGQRSQDPTISATDDYLNQYRPTNLVARNISRHANLYAFVCPDQSNPSQVINITDGQIIDINQLQKPDQAIVKLLLDPSRCYISNLDLYDQLKQKISSPQSDSDNSSHTAATQELATQYWQQVMPVAEHLTKRVSRPELMITYDVTPDCIEVVTETTPAN